MPITLSNNNNYRLLYTALAINILCFCPRLNPCTSVFCSGKLITKLQDSYPLQASN